VASLDHESHCTFLFSSVEVSFRTMSVCADLYLSRADCGRKSNRIVFFLRPTQLEAGNGRQTISADDAKELTPGRGVGPVKFLGGK